MKYVALITVMLLVGAASGCRRADYRTFRISVPDMKNAQCGQIVRTSVAGLKGVESESVIIDMETRTVTVTYDSLFLSLKNIEFAIAEAGFRADDVPADEEAVKKLPLECRPSQSDDAGSPSSGAS